AARLPTPWMRMISSIWRPTRMSGLRAVMGSWKIMVIFFPRWVQEGMPLTSVVPDHSRSVNPMTASAVRVLPDPDSPIRPTRSPGAMVKETSFTRPSPMVRLFTSSTAHLTFRVGGITQAVTQQVESQHRHGDGHTRPHRQHGGDPQGGLCGLQHPTPAGVRGRGAQPEETQSRLREDGQGEGHRRLHDEDAGDIG